MRPGAIKARTMPVGKKRARSGASEEQQPKKQRYVHYYDGYVQLTVSLTGAREGDVLVGCKPDSANALFRVVQGVIPAVPCIADLVPRDDLVRAVAKRYNVSYAIAEQKVKDIPRAPPDRDNAQPLGRSCTHAASERCECECEAMLQILQPGALQMHAAEAGFGDQMEQIVRERRVVSWRDILVLMGKKLLVLRTRLYQVVVGPQKILAGDPRLSDRRVISCAALLTPKVEGRCEVFEVGDELIALPPSGTSMNLDDVLPAVSDVMASLKLDTDEQSLRLVFDALLPLTVGGLKSVLQKCVRFGAQFVSIRTSLLSSRPCPGEAEGTGPSEGRASSDAARWPTLARVPAAAFAATACALIFASKGSFQPELQLFSRGCTAAFKRVGIIMVEDGWARSARSSHITALFALALVTQRMAEWHPPRCAVLRTIRLCAQAVRSNSVIGWRDRTSVLDGKLKGIATSVAVSGESALEWDDAARVLRTVRSFEGDHEMLEKVARMAARGHLRLWTTPPEWTRPQCMPMDHVWDQHVARGIAHLLPASFGDSFKSRFNKLFSRVTGVNPRYDDATEFESRAEVAAARFAQQHLTALALKEPPEPLDVVGRAEYTIALDPGTLAAAVGPVSVLATVPGSRRRSRRVLVILGVNVPEEEVVMLPPTDRNPKDLYSGVSDAEKEAAISWARGQVLQVKSPLLGEGEANFDGVWKFNGTAWSEVCEEGVHFAVDEHPPPTWCVRDSLGVDLLRDDAAVSEAMKAGGSGAVLEAEKHVRRLVRSVPNAILHRARSMLVQQYKMVSMPVPGLRGEQRGDQLMPYDGDWDAFRLLLLLKRLVPGALRLAAIPRFVVTNAALLRLLERWMLPSAEESLDDLDVVETRWNTHVAWRALQEVSMHHLMEHQAFAVARMLERDATRGVPGHYVVMDTGMGKTRTALCYLRERLASTVLGATVRWVLWIAPKATVEDLLSRLSIVTLVVEGCKKKLPVFRVPRPKVGKHASSSVELRDFAVNVIDSDFLRVMIQLDLPKLAPSCAVVFDEVDTMYEPTQRTSACRRLAKLCPVFVAQTATPMSKNVTHLASWLADTEQYPVDSDNYLVAASGMVSLQIALQITAVEVLVRVPLHTEVRAAMKRYCTDRDWLSLARSTQHHTDAAMCDEAARLVRSDLDQHKHGGFMLVAMNAKHAAKLVRLMEQRGIRAGLFEEINNNAVQCIVVTQKQDRGYNGGVRFGGIVKGAYAGNGASRHQMRGRVRRIGQVRSEVKYVTVVMENSMLELLHERQQSADGVNISLQELAHVFDARVLSMLKS